MTAAFVTATRREIPKKNAHDPLSLKENRSDHLDEIPGDLRLTQFKAGSGPRDTA
jgi:hypothetical protein